MSQFTALWLGVVITCVSVQGAQNTVTFDNQSGEDALVKIIGLTYKEVEVPKGAKRTVDASAGRYFIKVRYGAPSRYRYTKGEEFDVQETATTRSAITITLHKVVAGNYDARPISEKEFNQEPTGTQPAETRTSKERVSLVGKLLNSDGKPASRANVFLLRAHRKDGEPMAVLSIGSQGEFGNQAVTDTAGNFGIEVDRSFLLDGNVAFCALSAGQGIRPILMEVPIPAKATENLSVMQLGEIKAHFYLLCEHEAPSVRATTQPDVPAGRWKLDVTVTQAEKLRHLPVPKLDPWSPGRTIRHHRGYQEEVVLDVDEFTSRLPTKPLVALVKIQNATDTRQEISIPLLLQVVLRIGADTKCALAFFSRGPTSSREWAVNMQGPSPSFLVDPKEAIELMYLMPSFKDSVTMEITGVGKVQIVAPETAAPSPVTRPATLVIKGKIGRLDEARKVLTKDSCVQLFRLIGEEGKWDMSMEFQGKVVSLKSDLPECELGEDGSFVFEGPSIKPGRYGVAVRFLRVQIAIGKEAGSPILLAADTGKLAVINVGEKPEVIDLGELRLRVPPHVPPAPADQRNVTVKAVIENWTAAKKHLYEKAYFQLVPVRPDEKLTGVTKGGTMIYDTQLPKGIVTNDGCLQFQCPRLAPGKYLIVIQGQLAIVFPPPKIIVNPILHCKQADKIVPAIVNVPEEPLPEPATIDLSKVYIHVSGQ